MVDHKLTAIDWPDNGAPALPPRLTRAELAARLALIRDAMAARGLDALVIYGDREHAANLAWASGFDPRFEEALMVIRPDGPPVLMAGNECLPYAAISPAVAAGDIRPELSASLSLISQPRGGDRLDVALGRAVAGAHKIGTAGWKYWTVDEVAEPEAALEIPALIADMLRETGAAVVNVTDIFMHPGHGLRSIVALDDMARMEFANHMAAGAVRRMIFALRDGMVDFDVVAAGQLGGLPLACHVTLAAGDMAHMGLSGPTGARVARGRPLSLNVCHWGANICRAGWAAKDASDLPAQAGDYVEAFVAPYLDAISQWCSLMRPGVSGGMVQTVMDTLLPDAIYGITLNPGHLIGMDEWISSPIYPGSVLPLRAGMAMQCDIIPESDTYGSTRMEDGYVIANAALIHALERGYPDLLDRARARQAFMRDVIGLDVPDDLLPLADTCGIIAPFLLAPRQVLTLT